jgi:hypothetical protein
MSSESLSHELSQLSRKNLTTMSLSALDFVIPGSYQNTNSLDDMVQVVTGDVRAGRLQAISNHVDQLYQENAGARRAVWLYQLTDSADKAVAAASLANKVGSKYSVLSFLAKMTPKADTSQAIDLCLKLTVEALAHLSLHGISKESIGDWVDSLGQDGNYSNEAALRLAAIVGFDGMVPLGPDFLGKATSYVNAGKLPWSDSALFKKVAEYIPGGDVASKSGFVGTLLQKASAPIDGFVNRTGLTREKVVQTLEKITDVTDSKLDYVAAFLDASTNFMSHTGVQSVARHLVEKAASRFGYKEVRA